MSENPFAGMERSALPPTDFELARHHSGLLAMLQEKAKGNLSSDEQRALDNSLAELRVPLVEAQKK